MVFLFFKRAALLCAALFISTSFSLAHSAEKKFKKAETTKDIIEKAYNLSLQKDRTQAVSTLVSAIKQETSKDANTVELKKVLQQVSYVFYSDRTQQSYEMALSMRRTDANQAQQKVMEALRVEPGNLSLFNELQRMLLVKGDCSAALDNITKERLKDPYDENLLLLQAQAQACLGKWEAYVKTRDGIDIKKSNQAIFWMSLEIEYNLATKNLSKAKEHLAILQKSDPKYPELQYWRWRIATPVERKTTAQKYLNECKNISPVRYRQYMTDVNLCRKVVEVENANKNGNGSIE